MALDYNQMNANLKQLHQNREANPRQLTYTEKLGNYESNAKAAYAGLGRTKYLRGLNYFKTMATVEQNGLNLNDIAPNYTRISDLMDNSKAYRQQYGEHGYEKAFNQAYNIAKQNGDITAINDAVKLKQGDEYSADLLNAAPEISAKFTYSNDKTDQLRKKLGLAPESFKSVAKQIVSAANKINKSQQTTNGQQTTQGLLNGINGTSSNPWDAINGNKQPTQDELVKAINVLNQAGGKPLYYTPEQRKQLEQGQQEAFQGTLNQMQRDIRQQQDEQGAKNLALQGSLSQRAGQQTAQQILNAQKSVTPEQTQASQNEAQRVQNRASVDSQVKTLTGRGIDDFLAQMAEIRNLDNPANPTVLPENWQKAWDLINTESQKDPTLLIPGYDEKMQNLAKEAGPAQLWNGASMGTMNAVSSLINQGGKVDTTELNKKILNSGIPLGNIVSMDANGTPTYDTGVQQNAQMYQADPTGYVLGNILGSLVTLPKGGQIGAEAAAALGLPAGIAKSVGYALPNAVQGFNNAVGSGESIPAALVKGGAQGVAGALGGNLSELAAGAVGNLVKNAPGFVQRVVPALAGSTAFATTQSAVDAGLGIAKNGKVDWKEALSSLPSNIALGFLMSGWHKPNGEPMDTTPAIETKAQEPEVFVHPITGEDITVPAGKTLRDVNPEAADFYDYLYKNSKQSQNTAETAQNTTETTPQTQPESTANSTPQNDGMRTRQAAKSVADQFANTPEGAKIQSDINAGAFQYKPESSVPDLEAARQQIQKNPNIGQEYDSSVTAGGEIKRYSKKDVSLAEALLEDAIQRKNQPDVDKYTAALADMGTELGRGVQAYANISRLSPEGFQIFAKRQIDRINAEGAKQFGKKWNDVSFTPEEQRAILEAPDADARDLVLKDSLDRIKKELPSTAWAKYDQFRKTLMLANPKTQLRNITGNVLMRAANGAKNKVRAGMELTLKQENRTTPFFIKKEYKDLVKGSWEQGAKQAFENNGKWEYGNNTPLLQSGNAFKNKGLGKAINKFSELTNKALEFEDLWFAKPAYETSLARYMQAKGLKEVTPEAADFALKEALEVTYRDYSKFAAAITNLQRKGGPGGKVISIVQPFVKTPTNVAKRAFEYSPLGATKTLLYDGVTNLIRGKYDANQFINNLAKGLTGTSLVALGYALGTSALPGVSLTGDWSDNDKERAEQKAEGFQPYSLKVGDTYFSINWAQPIAASILIGSDIAEQAGIKKNVVADPFHYAQVAIDSIGDLTLFKGVSDTLRYNNGASSVMANMAASALDQATGSSLLRQVASTVDQNINETRTPSLRNDLPGFLMSIERKSVSGIPGLKEAMKSAGVDPDIAPSVDVWGNTRQQSDNPAIRGLINLVSPANVSTAKTNSVTKEVDRLYKSTGDTKVLPTVFNDRSVTISGQKVNLTQNEVAQLKKLAGQAAYSVVDAYINSDAYKNTNDVNRAKKIAGYYDKIWTAFKTEIGRNKLSGGK